MTPYEIRYAVWSALAANAYGSGRWLLALGHFGPGQSLLVGILAIVAVSLFWDFAETPLPFMIVLVLTSGLVVVELMNARAFVSPTELAIHRGITGAVSQRYALAQIQRVEYVQYSWLGSVFDVGDVEIQGDGWTLTLFAVKSPEASAQAILDRVNHGAA